MIRDDKYMPALRALHDILVQARKMAGDAGLRDLHALLDDAEILPKYIASKEDNTYDFQLGVESICSRISSCQYIIDCFESPDDIPW